MPFVSSLNNLGWRSSGPAAFEEFKCISSLSTPMHVMFVWYKSKSVPLYHTIIQVYQC